MNKLYIKVSKELIRNVNLGYVKLFPELLDRFHNDEDNTIVRLIFGKVQEKSEDKFVNINELEKYIVSELENI